MTEIHIQMQRSDWCKEHTTLHANIELLFMKKEIIITKNHAKSVVNLSSICRKSCDQRVIELKSVNWKGKNCLLL